MPVILLLRRLRLEDCNFELPGKVTESMSLNKKLNKG